VVAHGLQGATWTVLRPDLRVLDDHPADLLVLTAFQDERPLEGLAGLVDWRLCGALSSWRVGGFSTGAFGEQVLMPTGRRLSHPKLLLMGLGPRAEHRADRAIALAVRALTAAEGLGVTALTTGLFGLDQLANPLERTAPKLVTTLREATWLGRVQLVATDEDERKMRDGIAFAARR
jgi:hypothetical protein